MSLDRNKSYMTCLNSTAPLGRREEQLLFHAINNNLYSHPNNQHPNQTKAAFRTKLEATTFATGTRRYNNHAEAGSKAMARKNSANPNGCVTKAAPKSKCAACAKHVVIPQFGHGKPVNFRNVQAGNPNCRCVPKPCVAGVR